MLKFFRRIRQNLLTKNKTGKYFKYVIGEIILVVIGILIALQINNWNERQKTQSRVTQFLKSLKVDLQTDLREIEFVIKEQTNRYESINQLINLSKRPDINEVLEQDTLNITRAGRNFTFFPVVGSYRGASSSGLIDDIKNEKLKNNILNLYEHFYIRLSYNGELNDNRYELVDWESRAYIDYTEKALVFDKTGLLNKDFVNQIGYLNRFISIYINRAKDTKQIMESILKEIESTF